MSAQQQFRLAAAVGVLAVGVGLGLAVPGASADPPAVALPAAPPPAAVEPAAKRREAVTRFPVGTFVKEFEAQPYGSGSLTFTYADDRVSSVIEVNAPQFGGEVEFATESELSMSRNGVIYGVINSVRLNKLKVNPELLGGLPIGAGAYPLVEPLVNEVLVDLPFSYRCRVDGDRITISNYRVLTAGPNPYGKYPLLGALGGGDSGLAVLAYGQAVGTAIEGTYTLVDEKAAKPARKGAKSPARE